MVLLCCFTKIKFTKLLKIYRRTFNTWLFFHKNISSSNNSLINKDLCCESYHAAKRLIILNILLTLEQISWLPGCVHECVCVYMGVQACVSIWVYACKYGWVVYMKMCGSMSVSFVWVWVYTVYGCMWVYECLWIYECVWVWVWVYHVHECVCVCVKVRVGKNQLIMIYNTNNWTLCCCFHYDRTTHTFINGYCTLSESWQVLHHLPYIKNIYSEQI